MPLRLGRNEISQVEASRGEICEVARLLQIKFGIDGEGND